MFTRALLSRSVIGVAAAFLVAPALASGQGPGRSSKGGPPQLDSPLKVSLTVGEQRHELTGTGQCYHMPQTALIKTPAASWTVEIKPEATTGIRSLGLTVWRTSDAAARSMFRLFMAIDRAQRRISTADGDSGQGGGTATVTPSGAGARFEIDGQTRDGVAIRGTIECERLAVPTR